MVAKLKDTKIRNNQLSENEEFKKIRRNIIRTIRCRELLPFTL